MDSIEEARIHESNTSNQKMSASFRAIQQQICCFNKSLKKLLSWKYDVEVILTFGLENDDTFLPVRNGYQEKETPPKKVKSGASWGPSIKDPELVLKHNLGTRRWDTAFLIIISWKIILKNKFKMGSLEKILELVSMNCFIANSSPYRSRTYKILQIFLELEVIQILMPTFWSITCFWSIY